MATSFAFDRSMKRWSDVLGDRDRQRAAMVFCAQEGEITSEEFPIKIC
jgi:hypothetical protein